MPARHTSGPFRGLLTLAALGLAAATPAHAQTTVFNTFGPGNFFSNSLGYGEIGPNTTLYGLPVGFLSVGAAFTPSASGSLYSVTVAYNHWDGTNIGHLYLTDDFGKLGDPSAALEGFTFTGLTSYGPSYGQGPVVGVSVLHPTLTAGTTYYVYGLETGNTYDSFDVGTTGATGTVVENSGNGYHAFSNNLLPSFSVQVTPAAVPEPSPLALLALGASGLWIKARRKTLPRP